MKRLLTITAAGLLLASCQDAPKADQAQTGDAQDVQATTGVEYKANTSSSVVNWVGTKPVGQHTGSFKLEDGVLTVSENAIKGGEFIIDISSIDATDQDEEYNQKLEGHLLSADFFQADSFPTGKFVITEVKEGVPQSDDLVMKDATHMITGNLTLKNITKSITFPAKVEMTDNGVSADASFNIDRTEWDMHYNDDKSLGDKFISHDVNLQVHLVAEKQS